MKLLAKYFSGYILYLILHCYVGLDFKVSIAHMHK